MRHLERGLLTLTVTILVLSISLVMERILVLALIPLILLMFPSGFHVKVRDVHFSPPSHVGDDVKLRCSIAVMGFGYAKIKLVCDDILEVTEGDARTGGLVPVYREFQIDVRGVAKKRGRINFGKIAIEFDDIFLTKKSQKELDIQADADVKVRVKKVRKIRARRRKVRESYPDIDISKLGVPGTDFREIREYIPGDPVKFINWKATARREKILVNEFEVEGKRAVWFVINSSHHVFADEEYFENALTVAASLAYYFTKRGHKTALTLTGSGKTLHPDLGKKQFYRIMSELILAEFDEKKPVVAVREVKKLMMYHMPFVIYITHVHDDLSALKELQRSGIKSKPVVVPGKEYRRDLAKAAYRLMVREKMRRDADILKETIRVRM